MAKISLYSFLKLTPGYNLSEIKDERTEDVYNHLRGQTEHDDDTYDHGRATLYHSTVL